MKEVFNRKMDFFSHPFFRCIEKCYQIRKNTLPFRIELATSLIPTRFVYSHSTKDIQPCSKLSYIFTVTWIYALLHVIKIVVKISFFVYKYRKHRI